MKPRTEASAPVAGENQTLLAEFDARGWLRFAAEPVLRAWSEHALACGLATTADPANAHWLRCGGTWFVGVDALPNDVDGRIPGGPPLAGNAIGFVREFLPGGGLPLHRAQFSVCHPGYPQPSAQETETAFRFRLERDAAHVDGLLAGDAQRRRFLREPHAWILGIGLGTPHADAAPTVVYDGSHRILAPALQRALAGAEPAEWPLLDITTIYQQARREAFAACTRREIPLAAGEALLVHRHALHGIAPWRAPATVSSPRAVAWFRPLFPAMEQWTTLP